MFAHMDFETAAIHGIVSIKTTTMLMNRLTNESCKLKIKDKTYVATATAIPTAYETYIDPV